MQSALAALTCLEDETRIWPMAAIRLSEKTVLPCCGTTQSFPWKESIGLCSQLPANNMRSSLAAGSPSRTAKSETREM